MADMDVPGAVRSAAQSVGLDPDYAAAVATHESSMNPNAVGAPLKNGDRAVGVMQLTPTTASDLGVDRNDPQQNITGGVRYLKSLVDKYGGDHAKAAAAYNAGPGHVDRNGITNPGYVDAVRQNMPNGELPDEATPDWNKLKPAQDPNAGSGDTTPDWNNLKPVAPPLGTAPPAQPASGGGLHVPSLGEVGSGIANASNYAVNSAMFGTEPFVGGLVAGGLTNLKSLLGGSKPGDMTGEQVGNRVRDLMQQQQEEYEKAHPMASVGLNIAATLPELAEKGVATGGKMLFNGADKLAGGALSDFVKAKAPKALSTLGDFAGTFMKDHPIAGGLVSGAFNGATKGAEQGVGQSLSEGQGAGGTAVNAVEGALGGGVMGGALGGVSQGVNKATNPLLAGAAQDAGARLKQAAVTGGAGALVGGAVAGAGAAMSGHDVMQGALGGAAGGAALGVHGYLHPAGSPDKTPDARDRQVAADYLLSQGADPDALRAAHPDATVADVLPNAPRVIRDTSAKGAKVKDAVTAAYGNQNSVDNVRDRIDRAFTSDGGRSMTDAAADYADRHDDIQNSPQSTAAVQAAHAAARTGQAVSQRVTGPLSDALNLDINKQRGNFSDYEDEHRAAEDRVYDQVRTGQAVDDPMVRKAMQVIPGFGKAVVKAAQNLQARDPNLDNVGWKPNPNYDDSQDTPAAPKAGEAAGVAPPPKDVHDENAAYLKTGSTPRMEGPNLLTFIRQNGGITDLPKMEVPDIDGISRPYGKNALSLDGMVEKAHDAGYLGPPSPDGSRPDQQVLIDAINNHTPENPIHPDTPANRAILEKRNLISGLHDQLTRAGIDPMATSRADLAQILRSGGDVTHMEREPVPVDKEAQDSQGQADSFLNPDIKTPKYLPTDATLIEAHKLFRDGLGSDKTAADRYSLATTMAPITAHLDNAIPGFQDAREFAGDRFKNSDWFNRGRTAFQSGSEAPDLDLLKRQISAPDVTDAMREAFAKGVAGAYGDHIEHGGPNFDTLANSPFHQGVRDLAFGPDANAKATAVLQQEAALQAQPKPKVTLESIHANGYDAGQKIFTKNPDPQVFAESFGKAQPDQQDAIRQGYQAKLNEAFNTGNNAVVEKMLSPDHQANLVTMFGKAKADALVAAARAQSDFNLNAKQNTAAAGTPGPEKPNSASAVVSNALHLAASVKPPGEHDLTGGSANAVAEYLQMHPSNLADVLEARQKEASDATAKRAAFTAKAAPVIRAVAGAAGNSLNKYYGAPPVQKQDDGATPISRPRLVLKNGQVYSISQDELDKRNALRGH